MTIGFRALNWTSRAKCNNGENSWIETIRLVRTETRHRYREIYFKRAFTDVKDKTEFWFHIRLLFVERSYIHHARVKANLVIENAVQCICLRTILVGGAIVTQITIFE